MEWSRFDQAELSGEEYQTIFDSYFRVLDLESLPAHAEGFDAGCGSGRWARGVASRVGTLHCIDASEAALAVARRNLAGFRNCRFHHASLAKIPLSDGSMDFGFSLGVLHHLPDPAAGLAACVAKLKLGAPFLVYLYYALDGRPAWYRYLWRMSNVTRRIVAHLPYRARTVIGDFVAVVVYWPLARAAGWFERYGWDVSSFPLASYRQRRLYTMRTDALDRLGTRLERRFTRQQIITMMQAANLVDIRFSDEAPYWCAVGRRAPSN